MKERPYESTDLPSVIEIYTASIRSLAASYYSPHQIAAWAPVPPDAARWQERLSHLHTIVAESDGVLAGFASYTHQGYLDFLFTHPTFARRGVATSLYQRVESALRAVSAPELRPTPVLPPGHSSNATASNSMQRSASSAEGTYSAGSSCTNNFAMNETPNQTMQTTPRTLASRHAGRQENHVEREKKLSC